MVDIRIGPGPLGSKVDYTELASSLQAIIVPVGGIIAWAKSITGIPSIPAGFIECDGSTISDNDSPIDGETVPDLNGNNNFLRGASASGGTGGAATHTHDTANMGTGSATGGGSASSLPPYYEVVWIIRIK